MMREWLKISAIALFTLHIGNLCAQELSERLEVPEGYALSLFAADIDGARVLRVTPAGDLVVSLTRPGEVWWLARDANGDGRSDGRKRLFSRLERPNGLEIRDGLLYVAENTRVFAVPFDVESGTLRGEPRTLVSGLPEGGSHFRKVIRFGPDGLLYLVIGSSCNVCMEKDSRRAAMHRYSSEGEYLGVYATGLRNSAGFDWKATGELYATDNGRDMLGDDYPVCELNRIVEGGFYGWPFANGFGDPDPNLGEGQDERISASIDPEHGFRAHNAPLGIEFLQHEAHPEDYGDAAIVALHGSWNRSSKDGYKVVSLHWSQDPTTDEQKIEERDFMWGFLEKEKVIGRPAEVAEDASGNIYISDDYADAVYMVSPRPAQTEQETNFGGVAE